MLDRMMSETALRECIAQLEGTDLEKQAVWENRDRVLEMLRILFEARARWGGNFPSSFKHMSTLPGP